MKTDENGGVYVGGEIPNAIPAPVAVMPLAAAPATAAAGILTQRALGKVGKVSSDASVATTISGGVTPSSSHASLTAIAAAAAPYPHVKQEPIFGGIATGAPPGNQGARGGVEPAREPTAEEKADKAREETITRAFGDKGNLPHAHGPTAIDETMPLHTEMLLDRSFWLASSVSQLPAPPPATPWLASPPEPEPSPIGLASDAGACKGGKKGRNSSSRASAVDPNSGRCAVCVVQKKGRCGTDTAPLKCQRRGGSRAGSLDDPFDAPSRGASPEPSVAYAAVAAAASAAAVPTRRAPTTPLAASTASLAAMKAEMRREREREERRYSAGGGKKGSASDDADAASDASDSESDPADAEDELEALTEALNAAPELRAAAPTCEVDGEILALQYELLWQTQARSVRWSPYDRVGVVNADP
eukprot:31388-Pelagococcus_subviridis.AAC.1